jgi:hypothetical protein
MQAAQITKRGAKTGQSGFDRNAKCAIALGADISDTTARSDDHDAEQPKAIR